MMILMVSTKSLVGMEYPMSLIMDVYKLWVKTHMGTERT